MNARERRSILRAAYNASKAGQAEARLVNRPYLNNRWARTLYVVSFREPMDCRGCKMPQRQGYSYETRFIPYAKRHRPIPNQWSPFKPKRWRCWHCRTWNTWLYARLLRKPTRRNDSYMKRQSRPR